MGAHNEKCMVRSCQWMGNGYGIVEIPGWLWGPFGFYRTDDGRWCIVEQSCGTAVGYARTLRLARQHAEAIRPLHKTWRFKSTETAKRARAVDGRPLGKALWIG